MKIAATSKRRAAIARELMLVSQAAHMLQRTGLAMAGAMGGTFVAAQLAKSEVAMFGSGGRGKVADVKAGDSAYIPAGYGHAIVNTGEDDLEVVQTWDSGKFEEITLKHWVETSPKYLLANNMAGVPEGTLDKMLRS